MLLVDIINLHKLNLLFKDRVITLKELLTVIRRVDKNKELNINIEELKDKTRDYIYLHIETHLRNVYESRLLNM